ncbi:PspC domain-containing protein [Nocardioides acrostichi]|uniref:PspC domain-containing protein n=1 Tax=Nocardioides acrostichi TaxID=2784339 RepID=A0A930UVQ8_9ACTN|nr:PspC domain-containing protein [Nocardioides acrostichi]MBF4161733.1 PspC domain-containing protein [Nocardioides acrostichi]
MTSTPPGGDEATGPQSATQTSDQTSDQSSTHSATGYTDGGPRVTRDELRDLSRLARSTGDRKLAGVAGGVARHLDVDPVIVRVGFAVLVLFGGAGLLAYVALWLLMPLDDGRPAVVDVEERNRSLALTIIGAVCALVLLSDVVGGSVGGDWLPWPLVLVAVVVIVLVGRRRERGQRPPTAWRPDPNDRLPEPREYAAAYAQQAREDARTLTLQQPDDRPLPPPPPPRPRRPGPILFWFTLALVALAEGVLGTVAVAGTGVPASAYPALALGVVALMLLVGSVYGRPGGLVLLGLLTLPVLGIATAADHIDPDEQVITPLTAAEVQSDYDLASGAVVLDLSAIDDVDALDGRVVRIHIPAGTIEVRLPKGLSARATGDISGPGHLDLFGAEAGGIGSHLSMRTPPDPGTPFVRIVADTNIGEIQVTQP